MLCKVIAALGSSVRTKIMLLVVVAVAVIGVCSGIFIVQTRANIQAQVFRDQSALAHTYAGLVEESLRSWRGAVESAAALPAVRAPLDLALRDPAQHGIPAEAEPQRREELAAARQGSDGLLTLLLTSPGGQPYALDPYAIQATFRDDSVDFGDLVSNGMTSWFDVFTVDLGEGEVPAVGVAVPIKGDAGQVVSVLVGTIKLDGLSTAAQKIPHGETGQVMLFDSRGVPIVYPDPARVTAMQPLGDHPLVSAAMAGRADSQAYKNLLNGQDELGTAVRLDNGWLVVVTQAQAEAFAGLNQTVGTLLIVLMIGVVVLVGAGLFLAHTIARGIGAVSRAAIGLASGDLDQEVDVWSRDEIGRLATSFRKMIAYHRRMAGIADAVAGGDLTAEVLPQSSKDRLGIALQGMMGNLHDLVGRLERLAFHDPLTGLANRALFLARLKVALERTGQPSVGVLFIDLDNFKIVNDSLGHAAGDGLLTEVAVRLQRCAGPSDTVARLGGDEFTILLCEQPDERVAMVMAKRIADQFMEPVHVGGHSLVVSASIGIALGGAGQESPGDLLRAADLALYAAKDAGKAQARMFNPTMGVNSLRRLELDFEERRGPRAA